MIRISAPNRFAARIFALGSATLLLPGFLAAQQRTTSDVIHVSGSSGAPVFRLDSNGVTYAFGVNAGRHLQAMYWGGRVADADPLPAAKLHDEVASFDSAESNTPQEYGGWGRGIYPEPALKISFPDGDRELDLVYNSNRRDGNALEVVLKDVSRDVFVTLRYEIDGVTGIVARSARVENKTKDAVTVERCAAGALALSSGTEYQLHFLTGHWAGEFQPQVRAITPGKTVLESRRGSTSHENNPWFAIDRAQQSDPEHGDTWFGALGWSGSWSITVEQDVLQQVRVTAGYNSFDFRYKLAPGETLNSPVLYSGFTHDGLGGAARLMHAYELSNILPQRPKPRLRPVLYNSWEATEFRVDEPGQIALAEKAASIGAERFVMDDGWFGQRVTDNAGLGDWYVNQQKFPRGLKPLIDRVHGLGMDFGLWVEPEMVNPNSDLYRAHPDWVLNFPGRDRVEQRNQLVLNLARPDVRAYVFGFLDKLVTENDIAFLKWDYNRNWSEPGWAAVAPDEQQKVYVKYVENLYGILAELRAKHPKLEIESCSGGGGRVDLGIMRYTDEVWPSDNTDAFDRLTIQSGFTQAYTPNVMMAWVTDVPNFVDHRTVSLEYRYLSAMQGSLGIGSNLNNFDQASMDLSKKMIASYKTIRQTVQQGRRYQLLPPPVSGDELTSMESVSLDGKQAVLFAELHSSSFRDPQPAIRWRGLDPDRTYELSVIGSHGAKNAPPRASGRYWMEIGTVPDFRGDMQAAAFVLSSR